jgi:hypothetical protein
VKINPKTIRALNCAADGYDDDQFFAVKSADRWFISNWVLGLDMPGDAIINSPHFTALQEEADEVASSSVEKQDILYHLSRRNWMDLLVGSGIYRDADLVQLGVDEQAFFDQRGWNVLALETEDGKRFYVKEGYIDLADAVINGLQIAVFKPMVNGSTPMGYNPLILFDEKGGPRGLCSIVSDSSLQDLMVGAQTVQQHQDYLERNHVLETLWD